jgi:hypothetical protein
VSRHRPTDSWYADWDALNSEDEWHQFLVAFNRFCAGLERGRFPRELNVRKIVGSSGIYQLTWGEDRYATFAYDQSDLDEQGNPRIVWRRIGASTVLEEP